MDKLDPPRKAFMDTLPIPIKHLNLWRVWGKDILKHYLESPPANKDTIDWLDYFRANKN